jgi:hypothetical protein
MKPISLQQIEEALWRCILRIVSGASAVVQLSSFMQEYQALSKEWDDDSVELRWHQMPCM